MSHSFKATDAQVTEIINYYRGYSSPVDNVHTVFRAKLSDASISIYTTNTVLFQGKNEDYEYLIWAEKYHLDRSNITLANSKSYFDLTAIGTDEVGTGDFFGPVVVAGTYVTKDKIPLLQQYGVKDSKLLSDAAIIDIALKIKDLVPYSILILPNNKYNLLYQNNQGNLNFIKAYLHNSVILNLLRKIGGQPYDAILIDEFTPADKYFKYLEKQPQVVKNVTLIQKGESEHIAIACSSVFARAAFLKELRTMSKTINRSLLKGAGDAVDRLAAEIIAESGEDILNDIAKLNFSNTLRAKNLSRHLRKSYKPKSDSD